MTTQVGAVTSRGILIRAQPDRAVPGADFKPAKPCRALVALAAQLNRAILGRHTQVEIDPADLARLRALPTGCLLTPNHAHHSDPQVVFELARRAGRSVVHMATREIFDAWGGWRGSLLQRLGAFSVNRGGTNADAEAFARSVLVSGRHDVAMFPEGAIYLLNDLIMPLKPGVARLALTAGRALAAAGRARPMLIVPVAIKYRFTEDITRALDRLAKRLEDRVFGEARGGPLYPRIVRLGTELLSRAERAYGLPARPGDDPYVRLAVLRRTLLERLERKYFGAARAGFDFDRARKLIIRIQGLLRSGHATVDGYYGPPVVASDDPVATDLGAAHVCARAVAFPEEYLVPDPSPERLAETLLKLEREVLNAELPAPLGRRRAVVRLGPPIDATELLACQREVPLDDLVEAIVVRLHTALQGTLDAMDAPRGHGVARYRRTAVAA